jgi:putative membrane protein
MKKSIAILLLSASIFSVKSVCAQTTSTSATTSSSASTGSIANDTAAVNFITQATLSNLTEIQTGNMALKKAKKASVKAFGARMIKDHTKATLEMKRILNSKQFTPPMPTPPTADPMLANASGTAFDTAYITMMVQSHVQTEQIFKNAIANVQDPALKAFAVKMLPIIQEHTATARSIASTLNISTTATTGK